MRSPMMEHYLQLKAKYDDCILFYRLGDFYEMFYEDAIKASEILDLTLTGKNCGEKERAPMCGVPFHAADMYISKLISNGQKVAICEQLTEPNGKGLVERDVVRIVTAGTVINNEMIDEKVNNFICSLYMSKNIAGISWADITTGEFFVKSIKEEDLISAVADILVRINPSEIISNSYAYEIFKEMPLVVHGVLPKFTRFLDSDFNYENAKAVLLQHFNLLSLSSLGIDNKEDCVSSAGALITYLQETQKSTLSVINSIKEEQSGDFMGLDLGAIRNLELVKTLRDNKRYGSLLWLLDKTKTSMGARKLNNIILTPLYDKALIEKRLGGVEAFYNNTLIRQEIINLLSGVKDIGRITGKVSNGNLYPRDCVALYNSLEVLPNIKFHLLGLQSELISEIDGDINDFSEMVTLLKNAIVEEPPISIKDGGFIKKGFNKELDELRELRDNSKKVIAEIENREREKTGIKTLKVSYNRVFGYYIEVTNSFKHLVPYEYKRRQTIANAERYETDELKELEIKILSSEDQVVALENKLFNGIKEYLLNRIEQLKATSEAIAKLDVLLSLATVAKENGYVKPTILPLGERLNIIGGRHPVVEAISKQRFVPNDCVLDSKENRTMIITGPNMAGKSTYMRQVALITIMAQIGSFVPAVSAEIPLVDKVFTRIGASDNLISDQSTFMVEMNEVAEIIKNSTANSLLILDEIGRGTSTYDGLSIAWAVVEYLTREIKAKTLFATHYHELTELEGKLEGIKNYKVTVKEMPNGIIFLRKIMRGGTNKSFGIEVAELAGVNKAVTDRAREILKTLHTVKRDQDNDFNEEISVKSSEIENILKDIDINNISPIQAFNVLTDLVDKVKGEN